MIFEVIPSGSDNLCYLAAPGPGKKGLAVDPVNVGDTLAAIKSLGLTGLAGIVNTHGHPDHTGGNNHIARETGAPVISHRIEASGTGATKTVEDGDIVDVDGMKVKVIHTPGHTAGSICLLIEGGNAPRLVTGDTLFIAGCGNPRFGGDPAALYESFSGKLIKLPDDTIVHPGHDYALKNLEFALSREPGNAAARKKFEQAQTAAQDGKIIGSALGEEKSYNPFFRYDSEEIYRKLKEEKPDIGRDGRSVFLALRELRNKW